MTTQQPHRAQLEKIYNDPNSAGALGGVERFRQAAQAQGIELTRAQALSFLSTQNAYTLHKPSRTHFSRNPTIVGHVDQQWQADLCDLTKLAHFNGGNRYILTVIDCFSRYAWAEPVKRKDGPAVTAAFTKIFARAAPRLPKKLQTDKGLEFYNVNFRALLDKHGIELFSTGNYTVKAAMVERFNRTLKTRLWAYFTGHNTKRWLGPVVDIVKQYNLNKHRSLFGHSPAEVVASVKLQEELWQRNYAPRLASSKKPLANIKTPVRVTKYKTTFQKGYLPRWTGELYKVGKQALAKAGNPVYKLEDWDGYPVEGTFYKQELQPVKEQPDQVWQVEKVLRKRRIANSDKYEHLVKWRRWADKFNRWLTEEQLAEYGRGN